jgi:hypothetical protein
VERVVDHIMMVEVPVEVDPIGRLNPVGKTPRLEGMAVEFTKQWSLKVLCMETSRILPAQVTTSKYQRCRYDASE